MLPSMVWRTVMFGIASSGFKRSVTRVERGDACLPPVMVWKSGTYPEPGLFGLEGGVGVALEALKN